MKRCPARFYRGAVASAVGAALQAREGLLPAEGGLFDQTAAFVAVCRIVDGELARVRDEEREAAEAKRGKA